MHVPAQGHRQKSIFAGLFLLLTITATQASELDVPALIERCAPDVHPTTMLAVLTQESGLDPFIIGVNGGKGPVRSATAREATQKANALLAQGANIDMGLAQINSANLVKLGLTTETVFDPCSNLRASAYLLEEAYERMSAQHGESRQALDATLSIYNTGRPDRGISNGYVGKVRGRAYRVPSLDRNEPAARTRAPEADPDREPPVWDSFARAQWDARQRTTWDPYAGAAYGEPREEDAAPIRPTPKADGSARVLVFDD